MATPAQRPRLTFACEVDAPHLTALFAQTAVREHLQTLGARVALTLADLSDARAAIVQRLNHANIPVVGIPLLSLEEGYYFTPDNTRRAGERYQELKVWTARHGLVWDGIGLDIEPDVQFYLQIMRDPWGLAPMLLRRLFQEQRARQAAAAYTALVARIRLDGYRVENYQFPLISDERWAGSTLLQRLLGLVDVSTDCEVWMLYTSVLPGIGPGLLWTYAADAVAVGVGSTGGGPDIPGHPRVPALDWPAFARDLRLAHQRCDNVLIHSLEGCVEQGFFEPAHHLRLGAHRAGTGKRRCCRGFSLRASRHPPGERASVVCPCHCSGDLADLAPAGVLGTLPTRCLDQARASTTHSARMLEAESE